VQFHNGKSSQPFKGICSKFSDPKTVIRSLQFSRSISSPTLLHPEECFLGSIYTEMKSCTEELSQSVELTHRTAMYSVRGYECCYAFTIDHSHVLFQSILCIDKYFTISTVSHPFRCTSRATLFEINTCRIQQLANVKSRPYLT